jgi:hypothetical protein
MSSYSYYFCEFYMNLLPFHDIYVLTVLIGVSDIIGTYSFYFLAEKSKKMNLKLIKVHRFAFFATSMSSLILFLCLYIRGTE